MGDKALVGQDITFTNDLVSQYTCALSSGYSFISIDLFHPKWSTPLHKAVKFEAQLPPTRSDLVFQKDGKSISRSIVGKISGNLDLDSEIPSIKRASEIAFQKELDWATHLGLPAISVRLCRPQNPNLARTLVDFIRNECWPVKIWITVPMSIRQNLTPEEKTGPENEIFKDRDTPWHWWMQLSNMASDISDSLGLLLELPVDLPDEAVIARWLSEPVVCLLLRTDLFLTNSKGYPVLPKSHQLVIRRFFKLNVQVLITGACHHDRGYITYQQYITWMWKNQAKPDIYEQQSKGLEDRLQEPLQPLRDNLSSVTYAIFEMDPYKYHAYEMAIYEALLFRTGKKGKEENIKLDAPPLCPSPNKSGDHTSPVSDTLNSHPQIVMILGAGRGPLVNATLAAAEKANCPVRVFAIEKNPNALFTLQDRMTHEWRGLDVHLIGGDMRDLNVPEKADIFVSELLGSFGDNELSPECLDGAQPFLKDDGISIPCSYTSYITPIQSLQFYNETKRPRDTGAGSRRETPYVVRLLNCQLLAEPQPAFTFCHPKRDPDEPNSREVTCRFSIPHDATVHGLAGYFEAKLFGDVTLSTHPRWHSPHMISWFPLAFPFDHPVHIRAGDDVVLHLWRVVSPRHVWYEWALTEPCPTRLHNGGGFAYKIAL